MIMKINSNLLKFFFIISVFLNIIKINGQVSEEDYESLCIKAEALIKTSNYSEARDIIRRIQSQDSTYSRSYIIMGDIYAHAAIHRINSKEDGRLTFDDVIVFEMAYEEYEKAIQDSLYYNIVNKRIRDISKYLPDGSDFIWIAEPVSPRVVDYSWIRKKIVHKNNYQKAPYINTE